MSLGCFGSHPEDRAMARELDKHLNAEAEKEKRAELIEEYAGYLFQAKMALLPTMRKSGFGRYHYSCCGDVLRELPDSDMAVLAVAIQKKDAGTAGREIIRLFDEQLQKESKAEAEDCYDNNY